MSLISMELPEKDVGGAMRRALRVDGVLGPYADVRYVGHSMGAYLGSGTLYPCQRSVSIGQRVPCDARRIVWGDAHRALGLPDTFYLPVSHVLEPWTPSVVCEAVSRLLPTTRGARSPVVTRIALAWGSVGAMMIFGVLLAKQVRASGSVVALAIVATLCACSRERERETASGLHEGDIVFQTSRSSQSRAIQLAIGSRFSHVGLVWKIYKEGLGVELGELRRLGDFDRSHPAVRDKLRERYGANVPLDEPVISPGALADSPLLETVTEK